MIDRKILEVLGRGWMGIVYMAEDTKFDRAVILKFLSPPDLTRGDEAKERFIHESKTSRIDFTALKTLYQPRYR